MEKTCNRCNKKKEIGLFYKNPNVAGGIAHQCKDCVKKSAKNFYIKNYNRLKEERKVRYWKDPEGAINKSVVWGKKNKDKRKLIRDRWTIKNKFSKSVMNRNWNAKKLGANGSFTAEELLKKITELEKRCGYCLEGEPYTIDHILPISKGGSNYIDNIMPACLKCNGQKRDYTIKDWLKLPNCYNKNKTLIK